MKSNQTKNVCLVNHKKPSFHEGRFGVLKQNKENLVITFFKKKKKNFDLLMLWSKLYTLFFSEWMNRIFIFKKTSRSRIDLPKTGNLQGLIKFVD